MVTMVIASTSQPITREAGGYVPACKERENSHGSGVHGAAMPR
jgi:hypothetical protein